MGWLFTPGQDCKELVKRLTRTFGADTNTQCVSLTKALRGDTLWVLVSVQERKDIESPWVEVRRRIDCNIIKNGGGDGWGYKDVSVTSGGDTCPVGYIDSVLELCPDQDEDFLSWAADCRERDDKAAKARSLRHGDLITFAKPIRFKGGGDLAEFVVERVKSWRGGTKARYRAVRVAFGDRYADDSTNCLIGPVLAKTEFEVARGAGLCLLGK